MASYLFIPNNLRRPHSTDDLLRDDIPIPDKSLVRRRPRPVSPRPRPVSRPESPMVLAPPSQGTRPKQQLSPPSTYASESGMNQTKEDSNDGAESLILLSPKNKKAGGAEYFNLDLDSLYANGSQKSGERSSANISALNLESPNSDWYSSSGEEKVAPMNSMSGLQIGGTQTKGTNCSAFINWPSDTGPNIASNSRPVHIPTNIGLPTQRNNPWVVPLSTKPLTIRQSTSGTKPNIQRPTFSDIFPQACPSDGDLLDLSKDRAVDARNVSLSSFDPFSDKTSVSDIFRPDENDPFQVLWDSHATAKAVPDPFKIPAATNLSDYEDLQSAGAEGQAKTPVYAQLHQPLYHEVDEMCSSDEEEFYEEHNYEEIRDPFSIMELNLVLEHHKKLKSPPGGAGKYEMPSKPSRPPRPLSTLERNQQEVAMYEPLRNTVGANDEEIAFCDMVAKMKSEYTYEDNITNKGFLVSPVVENMSYINMSVKVSVETKFSVEPVVFTCDLKASMEHVIVQVICTLSDDMSSISTDDYVLKVYGLSEYFVNDSYLGDYAYVHQCIKMDEDIRLVMMEVGNMDKSLLRTSKDGLEPVLLTRPNRNDVINRESLSILMEIFYKEVGKVQEQVMKGGCVKIKCQSIVQSVKAICAILGGVETNRITAVIYKLEILSEIEVSIDNDIVEDPNQNHYSAVKLDSASVDAKRIQIEELQCIVDELVVSVKHLVKNYCQTFRLDFSFGSLHMQPQETKDVTNFLDNFIVQIESAHRIPAEWKQQYDQYCVIAALYHGGRKVHQETMTVFTQITEGFTDKLSWDEWLQMDISLCTIPRECRLVMSLVGVKTVVPTSGSEAGMQVHESLGWSAIQLFDYKGMLVQHCHLLTLWPGDPQPIGTTQPNTAKHTVLLKISLPELGCKVSYPNVPDSPNSHACDFDSLHPDAQEELLDIISKDSITKLTSDESEFLWEKRHYLFHYPAALPKLLDICHGWDWACLPDLYAMITEWDPLEPAQALELLMPRYADSHLRHTAVRWLKAASSDELIDYLPQLVQSLKFESYSNSALARFLLERSVTSVRVAHHLFWYFREAVSTNEQFQERYQLMLRALLSLVGENLKKELDKQESIVNMLSNVAELVRAAKDKEVVLQHELQQVYVLLEETDSMRIPINPSMEITGIDLKLCSYFNSFTTPLKLVFKNVNPKAGSIYTMFKVGDDLRQDMLIMQMVCIIDKLWQREGLDLRIITFACLLTSPKKGMIELVTGCETLRKIQVTNAGLAGSFKDKPLYDWLQKHNPTELEYTKAVANFTQSCAGYCVITYVLGICDRHNDNIMIKETGHMFHIDFAKILGDAQMFGNIKRDRVPFVLTSDMAYVINGGDKPSQKFQGFVDLCCQAFNIIRHNSNILLNLILLMHSSGIPGVNTAAAVYVQKALLPGYSDAEATAMFTRMIEESLRSVFTQINFFFHNLAQLKFHGHNEGELLSFIPKTYSLHTDGKITNVNVHGYQKRYSPEKYYIYIIKVEREHQKVPSFVFRRYSEFVEFHSKLVMMFPLASASLPPLPSRLILGRSHVKSVAEKRKFELETFLKKLLETAPEIAECDLVYTFFHPMLRDEQDVNRTNLPKLREASTKNTSVTRTIGGQIKLSLHYKDGSLHVMIMHVKELANCAGDEPDPYVKTYLLPDTQKITKKKTKIARKTFHPTFNEMLSYHVPYNELLLRTLKVSVWSYDAVKENDFLGAVHIKLREVDLSTETTQWYTLGRSIVT